MKKILFSIAMLCCAIAGKSQSDVYTATLQHGNEVKVFYGTGALSEAINAAEDGDAINLSAGNFGGVNINKAVSVYGAGFEEDEETSTAVTQTGGLSINSSNVHVEGIYVNGNISFTAVSNVVVTKCRWSNSDFYNPTSAIEISKCVIIGNLNCRNVNHQGLRVLNSVLGSLRNVTLDSRIQVDHCIVYDDYSGPLLYTNSLLVNGFVYSSAIAENSTVYNCVIIANIPANRVVENCYVVPLAEIFTDGENYNYTPERTYELQHPEEWIGTDGTQCGLYGGEGWSKVPATPVLKNMTVEVDGSTLKVNYETQMR